MEQGHSMFLETSISTSVVVTHMYRLLQDGASSSERKMESSFLRVLRGKIGRISCTDFHETHIACSSFIPPNFTHIR